MPHELFSPEWIDAWRGEVVASVEYRRAAARWKWPVLLVARAAPELGLVSDRHVFLDLRQGECRELRLGSIADVALAEFVLTADAATWQEVVAGRLDAIGGVARGRIRLEKGSLLTLTMHAGAAKALIATAGRVASGELASPAPRLAAPAPPVMDDGAAATPPGMGVRHDQRLPMHLWRTAKRLGIWNPETIDFRRDREDWRALTDDERDLLLRLTALFVAGEQSVTVDLLPLMIVIAREGRLEEEMYLTSFLWEEAKHVDFFQNAFLRSVAPDAGDLGRYHTPAYRAIFTEELPRAMNALATDAGPAAQVRAAVTYNMIVEGVLAETGYEGYYHALEAHDLMPGLREGVRHIQQDESRHIAYGVYLLSRLIAADGALWDIAEARMNELLPLALETIGEAFAAYEVVPFGMRLEEFVDIATVNFNRRIRRIERARSRRPGA